MGIDIPLQHTHVYLDMTKEKVTLAHICSVCVIWKYVVVVFVIRKQTWSILYEVKSCGKC